jgi:hypothetical protein
MRVDHCHFNNSRMFQSACMWLPPHKIQIKVKLQRFLLCIKKNARRPLSQYMLLCLCDCILTLHRGGPLSERRQRIAAAAATERERQIAELRRREAEAEQWYARHRCDQ